MSERLRDVSTLGRSTLIVLVKSHRDEFVSECQQQGDTSKEALVALCDFEDETLREALDEVGPIRP